MFFAVQIVHFTPVQLAQDGTCHGRHSLSFGRRYFAGLHILYYPL